MPWGTVLSKAHTRLCSVQRVRVIASRRDAMVSMDVPGHLRAHRQAWRIRWDVLRRHILLSSLTGGGASCMVEVYHMATDCMCPEGVPYGSEETQNTASTAQAVHPIACASASDR